MAETSTQTVREAPGIEAYKLGLYESALDHMRRRQGLELDEEGNLQQILDESGQPIGPMGVPTRGVAGLSAEQRGAGAMLRSGLGAYEPYMSAGAGGIRGGMAAVSESAMPMMGEAYRAYGRGEDTLRDAERLAGATRGAQGQYQQQAMRGLTDEMGAARAGTRGGISALRGLQDYSRVLGAQGQAGMQDLARRSRAAGYGGQADIAALRGQSMGVGMQGRAGLQGMAGQSLGAAERGIAGLEGTGERYDPRSAKEFYDPYLQDVIQAEQAEIDRLGLQQSRRAQAGATSAGAFGGSRAAIQQSEIGRNVLGQQARTGAQLRSQGYQQAQQAAMGAFEQAQRRRQQAAQMTGQLGLAGAGQAGQQYAQAAQLGLAGLGQEAQQRAQAAQLGLAGLGQSGQQRAQASELGLRGAAQSGQQAAQASQLAQSLGQMGIGAAVQRGQLGLGYGQLAQRDVDQLMNLGTQRGQMAQGIGALGAQTGQLGGRLAMMGGQQAELGQMLQQANMADVSALMNLGNMTQQQAQNVLNAQYQAEMDQYQAPLQQFGFLADLTKALPSSQYAMLSETEEQPSWFQQGAGLATGIGGMMGAARGSWG